MNTLLIVTLLVLGLASILLLLKKDRRMVGIFYTLFAAVLLQWSAVHFDENGTSATQFLTVALVLGFLMAQFAPKKPIIGAIVSTALILGTFLLSGTGAMTINEITSQAETKFVVAGILLASFVPFAVRILLDFLSKFITGIKPSSWTAAMLPLFAGIGFLLASLTAPVYGPMLVGSAFLINSFFNDKRSGITGISVFALAAVPLIVIGQSVMVLLLNADVIAGLLIGAFAAFFVSKLAAGKSNVVALFLGYAVIFGVVFAFTYTGSKFEQMGGLDAFLAMVIGASIVHAIKGKTYQGISLLAPMLALGLIAPSLLVNEEQAEAEKGIIKIGESTVDENGEEQKGPAVLPMTDLSGNYAIDADASLVQFELGADGGRTKGQFKKVSGSFSFAEDLAKSKLEVTLMMENFTTFNSMRDKSLRSDDYFSTDKFPKMTFSATGFVDKGNNLFEAKGIFKMLGASKDITVTLQRVQVEDRIVLVGAGTLDRTEFGMTPSAAEGNVVDFNYQVELTQK